MASVALASRVKRPASSKRERERLRSAIEELNLKGAVLDSVFLTDELIQAVIGNLPVSVRVGVNPVIRARSLAVDFHSEANRLSIGCRTKHQVDIPSVEAEDDFAGRVVESGHLGCICPSAGESPLIKLQMVRQ